MRKELIRRSVSIAVTSLCMLLTVFCFAQKAQAIEPKYGGTLTVGTESEPRGFDPIEAGYISTRARSHIAAVVECLFDTGEEGLFDLKLNNWLDGPIFSKLRDKKLFSHVMIDEIANTICWPNGIDFCPDVVYKECKMISKNDVI